MTETVEALGVEYALTDGRNIIANSLRRTGTYQKYLIDAAEYHIRDGIVIDVGCNIGTFTLPLAKKFPNTQFHSFEPQRLVYQQFVHNVFRNRLENVTTYNIALGSKNKTVKAPAVEPNHFNGSALTLSTEVLGMLQQSKRVGFFPDGPLTQEYQVERLDIYTMPKVDLIKIDVEGMELEVLHGSIMTLLEHKPTIIFECWQEPWYATRAKQLMDMLKGLGYSISHLKKDDYIGIHMKESGPTL
jgi:FkbM family methyltransferase